MELKYCERNEYVYEKGLTLECGVLFCDRNDNGICKDFKEEKK